MTISSFCLFLLGLHYDISSCSLFHRAMCDSLLLSFCSHFSFLWSWVWLNLSSLIAASVYVLLNLTLVLSSVFAWTFNLVCTFTSSRYPLNLFYQLLILVTIRSPSSLFKREIQEKSWGETNLGTSCFLSHLSMRSEASQI